MKQVRIAMITIYCMGLFWLIYNSYFGWNEVALSDAERFCDRVFQAVTTFAVILYFSPLHGIYIQSLNLQSNNKNDDNR
jgi:hypothetical protein